MNKSQSISSRRGGTVSQFKLNRFYGVRNGFPTGLYEHNQIGQVDQTVERRVEGGSEHIRKQLEKRKC